MPRKITRRRAPKPSVTDPAVFDRYEALVIRPWRVQSAVSLGPCWGWTGPVDAHGYALLSVKGLRVRAARWVYHRVKGRVDGSTLVLVCHERSTVCRGGRDCPHRLCTNPGHWRPGAPAAVGAQRQARTNPYRQREPVD